MLRQGELLCILGQRFYCVTGGLYVTVSGLNAWVDQPSGGSAVTRYGTSLNYRDLVDA